MSDFAEGDMKGLHAEDVDDSQEPNTNVNGSRSARSDPDEVPSSQRTSVDEVTCHAADLVTKCLREEQDRSRSNSLKKEIPTRETHFLFNRHTITLDNENNEVDFRQAARDHLKTEVTQRWVSAQIELAKLRYAGKQLSVRNISSSITADVAKQQSSTTGTGETDSNDTYSCTCGHATDPNQMCIGCYTKYNGYDLGKMSPYSFHSAIKPYAQPIMSSLPEVDN